MYKIVIKNDIGCWRVCLVRKYFLGWFTVKSVSLYDRYLIMHWIKDWKDAYNIASLMIYDTTKDMDFKSYLEQFKRASLA